MHLCDEKKRLIYNSQTSQHLLRNKLYVGYLWFWLNKFGNRSIVV